MAELNLKTNQIDDDNSGLYKRPKHIMLKEYDDNSD